MLFAKQSMSCRLMCACISCLSEVNIRQANRSSYAICTSGLILSSSVLTFGGAVKLLSTKSECSVSMLCFLATGRKQAESNMVPALGGSGVDWDAPLAAFAPLQVTT